jgi:hypothetical protein
VASSRVKRSRVRITPDGVGGSGAMYAGVCQIRRRDVELP